MKNDNELYKYYMFLLSVGMEFSETIRLYNLLREYVKVLSHICPQSQIIISACKCIKDYQYLIEEADNNLKEIQKTIPHLSHFWEEQCEKQ